MILKIRETCFTNIDFSGYVGDITPYIHFSNVEDVLHNPQEALQV